MPRRLAGSITVRLRPQALKLVRARAKATRTTTSDVVRALIEAELQPPAALSALDLSRAWVGALRDANLPPGEQARAALEAWDPDRR
jgi:hypothetical protein